MIPDPSLVYLDGNSLGRAPKAAIARLHALAVDQWAGRLIRGWDDWISMPTRVGDRLAPLIGAHSGEVVVHDSTSINLYQLVHAAAALRPQRTVVMVADDEFPSDRYVAQAVAASRGLTVRPYDRRARFDDVAVLIRSLVDYRTAAVADLVGFTAQVTDAGALVVWDLCHAAGAIEVDLHAAGAELAVGCTYKFLNGGPGSPAFTFVSSSLHSQLQQPIHGWWSHHDQFETDTPYTPHADARRFLIGTPSILALAAAEEGINLSAPPGCRRSPPRLAPRRASGWTSARRNASTPRRPPTTHGAAVTWRSATRTPGRWCHGCPRSATCWPTSALPTSSVSAARH